jgi:thiamine-phosphate pyrophosphorylase
LLRLPPFYPILDTASVSRTGLTVLEVAEALLAGGAEILQFRHKDFWSREIFAQAEQVACRCADAGVQFIVNDRTDYAAMLGAGLHVGQDDLTPSDARRVIGGEAPLGFSTHTPDQMRAAQAEPVDYVAFGPVFATASKERPDATVGLEGLALARAITAKPLVAIGGITLENAAACWGAGADSVAIIGGLLHGHCTVAEVRDRMAAFVRESQTCRM